MTFNINDIRVRATSLFNPERVWLAREMERNELHPAVLAAFNKVGAITEAVLLQWPHRSVVDPTQLAYTRTPEQGEADRQTRTSVSKYLRAAFPTIKDHELRDLVYKIEAQIADGFEIVNTRAEMVYAVQEGPHSCMAWDHHEDIDTHPYACYCPSHGWSLAQRRRGDRIVSRALLYKGEDEHETVWVRAYGADGEGEALAGWLHGKEGFMHRGAWPRLAKLAKLYGSEGDILFPYIDGDRDNVNVNRTYLEIVDQGEYCCSNTDGTAEQACQAECENCGADCDEDDLRGVGRYGDDQVCSHCISQNFTYVRGQGGDDYYVHEDNAIEIKDNYYDANYPPKPIVELRDGNWGFKDESVQINGDWYDRDDDDIVHTEDGEWCLTEDTWTCEATGNVYSNDEEHVEVNGDLYHPSDAPDDGGYDKPDGVLTNDNQEEIRLEA